VRKVAFPGGTEKKFRGVFGEPAGGGSIPRLNAYHQALRQYAGHIQQIEQYDEHLVSAIGTIGSNQETLLWEDYFLGRHRCRLRRHAFVVAYCEYHEMRLHEPLEGPSEQYVVELYDDLLEQEREEDEEGDLAPGIGEEDVDGDSFWDEHRANLRQEILSHDFYQGYRFEYATDPEWWRRALYWALIADIDAYCDGLAAMPSERYWVPRDGWTRWDYVRYPMDRMLACLWHRDTAGAREWAERLRPALTRERDKRLGEATGRAMFEELWSDETAAIADASLALAAQDMKALEEAYVRRTASFDERAWPPLDAEGLGLLVLCHRNGLPLAPDHWSLPLELTGIGDDKRARQRRNRPVVTAPEPTGGQQPLTAGMVSRLSEAKQQALCDLLNERVYGGDRWVFPSILGKFILTLITQDPEFRVTNGALVRERTVEACREERRKVLTEVAHFCGAPLPLCLKPEGEDA